LNFIWDKITEWLKGLLVSGIMSNLSSLFDSINTRVGEVAATVGTTPQAWNNSIFQMIRTLSENVVVPIAGIILTFVMCLELIQLLIDRNNLHDFETFIFFKWIFKTFCAMLIVTNTWNIVMAVFDVAQHVVNQASGIIIGDTTLDVTALLGNMEQALMEMDVGPLFGLWFVGVPFFFLTKDALGTSMAAMLMIVLMLPFFMFAMFERHGQPLEVLLRHFIQARFIKPRTRVFQTDNFYTAIDQNIRYHREVRKILENQRKRKNQTDKG